MSNKKNSPTYLQVASNRTGHQKTPIPTEIARFDEIQNPPSLIAQKLFQYMVNISADKIADDTEHSFVLKDFKHKDGVSNFTTQDLIRFYSELMKCILISTAIDGNFYMGTLVDLAKSEKNSDGNVNITFRFGTAFRHMASQSTHWALIDQIAVYKFTHAKTILLYTQITSLRKLTWQKHKTFSLEELKRILGLNQTQYMRLSSFRAKCLDPIRLDINTHVNEFKLRYEYIKSNQTVTHVRIHWETPKERQNQIIEQTKSVTNNIKSYKKSAPNPMASFPTKQVSKNDPWRQHCTNVLGIKNFTDFTYKFNKWLTYYNHKNDDSHIIQLAKKFAETDYIG